MPSDGILRDAMRESKDGDAAPGGTDPLTRVDFWKRERVPEPPADHKTAGRTRRRLEGSVSLDRIVVASPGPATPQAASTGAEQADHQRQLEGSSALDWRQPDVARPDRAGVGAGVWLWGSTRVAALRAGALNGLGLARAHVSRRAAAVTAVAIAALGIAGVLLGQLGASTAGRARTPRVSAASIGNSPADRQPPAATRQNTGRSSAHVARRGRSRRVVRQRRSLHVTRQPAISRPAQVTGSPVATTHSTPPPAPTSSPSNPSPSPVSNPSPSPVSNPSPSPVSNPAPRHSSNSSSGSSSSKQPTWGQNGSLGPGHGVGTG